MGAGRLLHIDASSPAQKQGATHPAETRCHPPCNPPVPSLMEALPANHEVPPALAGLVERCLSRDPEERPSDADHLRTEMLEIVHHSESVSSGTTDELRDSPGSGAGPNVATYATPTPQPRQTSPGNEVVPEPSSDPAGEQLSDEESAQTDESGTPPRDYLVVATLLALFGSIVLGTTIFWFRTSESSRAGKANDATIGRSDRPAEVVSRAQSLVEEEKFGTAERLLETIDLDSIESAKTVSRVSALQERIATSKLLLRAKRRAAQGENSDAVHLYEKVLTRNPNHEVARKRLVELSEEARKAREERAAPTDGETATLTVSPAPEGRLFVDGEFLGETPASLDVEPGEHEVVVSAVGHSVWNRTVDVEQGGEKRLSPDLPPVAGAKGGEEARESFGAGPRGTAGGRATENDTASGVGTSPSGGKKDDESSDTGSTSREKPPSRREPDTDAGSPNSLKVREDPDDSKRDERTREEDLKVGDEPAGASDGLMVE